MWLSFISLLQRRRGLIADEFKGLVSLFSSSAATSLNFGSIAAAASEDLTITVAGASVNDTVILGLPAAPTAGIVYQGFVSAANTVTIRATNITGSPVNPAAQDFKVTVVKA